MHSLQYKFHDLRYKVEYYKTRYKQRYYSNDRNPRVIQTKLKNQRLLSLRTQPHDKYLLKPGEFLALVPKKLDRDVNQIIEVDTSRYVKAQFLKQRDLFKGYDDNALTEKSYSGFYREQNKYGNIRSYSDSIYLSAPPTDTLNICKSYSYTHRPNKQGSLSSGLSSVKSKNSDNMKSNQNFPMGTSWSTSPLIDLNSSTSDINDISKTNSSRSDLDGSITHSSNHLFDLENVNFSPAGGFSGIQLIGSKMQSFSIRRNLSLNTNNRRARVQNSWNLVLNAMSLPVAKVSVGLSSKTPYNFENSNPGLMNTNSSENKDSFRNRTHYIGEVSIRKDYSSEYRNTIEQNRFTDGNIQKYQSLNDSITQDHYYDETGFLSMYNYNSDKESSFRTYL